MALVLDVPVCPAPVPRGRRIPRVVEDGSAIRSTACSASCGEREAHRHSSHGEQAGMRSPVNAAGLYSACLTAASRIEAMASYRYLIVGGGMTADAACRGSATTTRMGRSDCSALRRMSRTFAPAHEGTLDRQGRELDLPRDARARTSTSTSVGGSSRWISTRGRRPTTRASRTHTRSCCSPPAARREAARGCERRHLLPHTRRLPPPPCACG